MGNAMQTVSTTAEGLRAILDGLLKVEGVTAALVVGRDGFVIEAAASAGEEADVDAVGAIAASTLGTSDVMGSELRLGSLGSILIEFEMGPVAVVPVGPEAVLAVVGSKLANLGRVRIEMKRIRAAVASQL